MTTFSQLVDKMIRETRRPDLRIEICSYLNQTIRELHFEPERENVVHYDDNIKEAQLTCDVEEGFAWTIPNIATFQAILAARYDSVWSDGQQVWADMVLPGRGLRDKEYRYYRDSHRVVFSGYGGLNATISLAWYEFLPNLNYYTADCRPCIMGDYGIEYQGRFAIHAHDQETAFRLCTNWLLMRWTSLIEEGLRAKIYKRLADDARARVCYSSYQATRRQLLGSAISEKHL